MSNHTQLERFQLEVYHFLCSDAYCLNASIIRQDLGVTSAAVIQGLSTLNENTGGKPGLCILVLRTKAEVENPASAGPMFDVVCTVRVLEMPLVNRAEDGGGTGVTHSQMAERVLHVLSGYLPKGIGGGILLPDRQAIEPYDADVDSGIIGWDITLRTKGGIASGDRVLAPKVNGTAAAVTLSCQTPGAAIYYTLDGSAPFSGNPLATAYSAPFAVDAGTQVRAGAQAAGFVASDSASLRF